MNGSLLKLAALALCAMLMGYTLTGCNTSTSVEPPSSQAAGAGSGSGSGSGTGTAGGSSGSQAGDYSKALDASWDSASAAKITLEGNSATVSGTGATVNASTVTITAGGTYVVSGTLDNGMLVVDATKDETVRLVLNGASLACGNSAAIYAKQCDRLILTLAEGTENSVTDGTVYQYADASVDEPDAAIFSKDDLLINGNGSLSVIGSFKNAIGTKDDLTIAGGTFQINAANDGLKGKDSVSILEGVFAIDAGGDAIQSSNDTDATKGWIILDGGTYTLNAGNDAVQAETALTVTGGTYEITSGGGYESELVASHSNGFGGKGGGFGMPPNGNSPPSGTVPPTGDMPPAGEAPSGEERPAPPSGTPPTNESEVNVSQLSAVLEEGTNAAETNGTTETQEASLSDSYKGLKAGTTLHITGGTFSLDSADDGIHANGNVTIDGGVFQISTGDDGIHGDGSLILNGGDITLLASYEGLEGADITMNEGAVHLWASDDGINAAGGSDGDPTAGRFGGDSFTSTGGSFVKMTGGLLVIDAAGDGLDANGSLYLEGGTVLVNGPTNSGNSALDYDGACEISGGVLAAAGSAGMAQSPGTASSQPSLTVVFSTEQAAGTPVSLTDASGVPILAFAPTKAFQSIIFSSSSMTLGETYTLSTGGTLPTDEADGFSTSAVADGGKLATVTLSESVTRISQDGSPITGGSGGMGGRGGGAGGGRTRHTES